VVPEILEPSLQLAAAVLSSMNLKQDEISDAIDDFRRAHLSDLNNLAAHSGGSLGYGYYRSSAEKGAVLDAAKLLGEPEASGDVIMANPAAI